MSRSVSVRFNQKLLGGVKILLAPNAYKECLSAEAVAEAMAKGISKVIPQAQIIKLPIADGGDGTLDVLIKLASGELLTNLITNPLGTRKIKARWGLLGLTKHRCKYYLSPYRSVGRQRRQRRRPLSLPPLASLAFGGGERTVVCGDPDASLQTRLWREVRGIKKTAVIEMAEAAGLRLVPPKRRNPLYTHTYGVGELIKAALRRQVRRIIIGLGGSATVEAGTGLARCLGIRLLDKYGKNIGLGGAAISKLTHIDISQLDERIKYTEFIGAYDVMTPLVGPRGAARTFAPQKGAGKKEVAFLAHNLEHLARIIHKDLGIDVRNITGGGAAGGLGAGLYAFCRAKLISGTELFLKITDYQKKLKGVDLVITGEGRLDATTLLGKAPIIIAQITKKMRQIPIIAISGTTGPGVKKVLSAGIDAYFSIVSNKISQSQAIKNATKLITQTTERVIRHYIR